MGAIHLVRHGQASWHADDYDKLSETGLRQSATLGSAWEASELTWTHAVSGSMLRHTETAVAVMEGAGFGDGYDVDAGWNEYDHLALTGALKASDRPSDARQFQQRLNMALERWIQGHPVEGETFTAFEKRVLASFDHAAAEAGSGQTVVVFTSGGPISLLASHVLAGDASLFQRLNNVVINASVTTFIVGSTGRNLLAFNEHSHLPRNMVTYR